VAIKGSKTGLIVTVQASGTPKTGLIETVDAGTGIQESSVQVPNGVAATLSFGRATTGVATEERLIKQAINSRADVAAP